METRAKSRIIPCSKCGAQNSLTAPEPGKKYYCSKCSRLLWQQPRKNWIELEDWELTREEEQLHKILKKNNPKILQWVEARRGHDKWLYGKSSWGRVLLKVRYLVFIIPIRAVAAGESWWQGLLIALAVFFTFSIVDRILRRYKVSKLDDKIKRLESELGGASCIEDEIERVSTS